MNKKLILSKEAFFLRTGYVNRGQTNYRLTASWLKCALHNIFIELSLKYWIRDNWIPKLVACCNHVCNCLISLGGSKVKRENWSNINKLMNHDPVGEGRVIVIGIELSFFLLKLYGQYVSRRCNQSYLLVLVLISKEKEEEKFMNMRRRNPFWITILTTNNPLKRCQITLPRERNEDTWLNRRRVFLGRRRESNSKTLNTRLPSFPTPFLCDNAPDGRWLSCYYPDNMTVMEVEVP